MTALASLFGQGVVPALFGAYVGYWYAIRKTPSANRPSLLWQCATTLVCGIGGAVIFVLFALALESGLIGADVSSVVALPALFAVGLSTLITRRYLKTRA